MINLKNPILKGSIILLLLIGFFNFLNFLYQVLMARTLSIEDFGLLKRVFVFLYFGGVLMESMQTIITKYSSTESKESKLKGILIKSFRKIKPFVFTVFFLFLLLSIVICIVFKIPYSLLLLTGIFLACSMIAAIPRGIIQSQKRFYALGLSIVSEGLFKVIISLVLVLLGWKVYGAIGGVLAGIIISFFISLFYLKKVLLTKESEVELSGIRNYGWPVLITTTVLIGFFNLDVLFAGYFFDDISAGIYAIASTIAIIIFIGVQPINKVLFPITARNTTDGKSSKKSFIKSLILILLLSTCALVVMALFPDLLVQIISGRAIPEVSSILIILGLGTSSLAVTSLILYYKLSQGKTSGYRYLLIFLLIELILLITFHNTLMSYALAFLFSNIIFLIGSIFMLNK